MPQITGNNYPTSAYTNFSVMTFPDWRALEKFAKNVTLKTQAIAGNNAFRDFVNGNLRNLRGKDLEYNSYGINSKHPKSYDEAMKRDTFIYYKEYEEIKNVVEKYVREELLKDSTAEVMKPRFVYNDKQIGEFIFAKAAMNLLPKLFYYSPSKKVEIDIIKDPILFKNEMVNGEMKQTMYLSSDNSLVVFAFKIKKKSSKGSIDDYGQITKKTKKIDGSIYYLFDLNENEDAEIVEYDLYQLGYLVKSDEGKLYVRKIETEIKKEKFVYVEAKDDNSLKLANKLGKLQVKSTNKKVYLYKEKKPRIFNSVKIFVGMTAGGFTQWINDFYTGVTAAVVIDVLEALGYSVSVEIAVGGGRCGGCWRKLNFNNVRTRGKRFFTFTAKNFDEQLDKDGLLYTLCDPSFHNIKWISLLNNMFSFFNDEIDTGGNPAGTWHGIDDSDMSNTIGMFHKALDDKKGNQNLLHFYIHQVGDKPTKSANINDVVREIMDIVRTCENLNLNALKKFQKNDFGLT